MVQHSTIEPEIQIVAQPEKSFLPRRAQPWEVASFVIGVPGAMASAAITCALVMYAPHGDVVLAGTVASLTVACYFTVMSVVWVGVASEQR